MASCAAFKGFAVFKMIQGFKAQGQPKFTVATMKAESSDWQNQFSAVGSLRAARGADLSAEVPGIVDSIGFNSGETVRAGTVLVRLRDADDRAKLDTLRAAAQLADIVYKRDQAQVEARALSQAQLDSDLATLNGANAQVAEQEALLAKKTIRAPFDGVLGIRAVDEGQYIAAGTKVVTLQQLDPIFADFTLSQDVLGQLSPKRPVTATVDAYPDTEFKGALSALDPLVDTNTRNISLRATLANHDHKLLPGMFGRLKIDAGDALHYITLPQAAVTYNPYGVTMYVVDHNKVPAGADGIAQQRIVKVGPTRGDQVAILDGIKEGDEVIVAGQIKLRNGALLTINNTQPVANDPNPKPSDQ